MTTTAILVDGGFYQKRARRLFGEKSPEERADELIEYCYRHLKRKKEGERHLYRIFYYDCPPSSKNVMNPINRKTISLEKSDLFFWTNNFFNQLKAKRKVALRLGELQDSSLSYQLKPEILKKLMSRKITVDQLTLQDFKLDIQQKGVDMRIGLDIASLAYKKLVNQIILIAGDSDFVPAAKHARREGIDFILDPMWHTIKDSLYEHIDGLETCVKKEPDNLKDPLCEISFVYKTTISE